MAAGEQRRPARCALRLDVEVEQPQALRGESVDARGRRAAQDALLERTLFAVSAKGYAEFIARLDAAPRPNQRLRRSLRTAAPWRE